MMRDSEQNSEEMPHWIRNWILHYRYTYKSSSAQGNERKELVLWLADRLQEIQKNYDDLILARACAMESLEVFAIKKQYIMIQERVDQLEHQLDAIRSNLDSLEYAAPEMREFWMNEIREHAYSHPTAGEGL